ncbi:hypothetical protein [Bacillus sp. T33-2]|uniref:hypothetical protein n=1 Tax=Bacillus sp. T33-2 TaxID=2054168 RepID=UPI000C789CA3|nr:hypothetical protein [Bacillus sp. T33-2]PLR91135.1 hypothetical protein CVD19_21915 [Bacillus sp. T33-2]
MEYPISVFIMDVTNSSSEGIGEELTLYLDNMVSWITRWTEGTANVKVKHRSGDEIIFIGDDYALAYTIAFFIGRVWKYKNNQPYFGMSFGHISRELESIDIEKWIHPLVKQARQANDLLKKVKTSRPQYQFGLDELYFSDKNDTAGLYMGELQKLMNTILRMQHLYIQSQTPIQQMVCSLYLIFGKQKEVGRLLHKNPSTISSHFKKGDSEEILNAFSEIVSVLNSLQKNAYPGGSNSDVRIENVMKAIKRHVDENLTEYFDLPDRDD